MNPSQLSGRNWMLQQYFVGRQHNQTVVITPFIDRLQKRSIFFLKTWLSSGKLKVLLSSLGQFNGSSALPLSPIN